MTDRSHYSPRQTLGDRYRPTGNWVNWLIFPETSETQSDWVWMKICVDRIDSLGGVDVAVAHG